MTRRHWFSLISAAGSAFAAADSRQAEVSAFDLSLLDQWQTPTELFFIREHFPAPAISAQGWTVAVAGVGELSFEQLLSMPRKTVPATIECAENPAGGGLVSHASWEGVSVAELMAKAQPKPDTRYLLMTAADGFARAIPLEKAKHPDTLLALRMNGQLIGAQHGGPARMLAPGWYGVDSLKWVRSLEFVAEMPALKGYRRRTRSLLAGVTEGDPVSEVQVKSVFARPLDGAVLSGRKFIMRGAAWAGENAVKGVEVSADGGKSWMAAQLVGEARKYCWVHWQREWKIARAGEHQLVVRAIDDQGRTQPAERPANRADEYEQNHWQRIAVMVL
ncbi:MAG: molybdopterin-dependent oxidoreductase [Bryobacterales bacterium]|nr:molybdopterin-dependent oxidoreductase [Bryobacterales bacterium]